MKGKDLLKLYKKELLYENLKIEIRKDNFLQKTVIYGDEYNIEKEPLLNEEIDSWFICALGGNSGDIVIDLKGDK